MSENHDKLVRAAIDTFARYGFRRSTMGDIATAAGLSRPTLYARFSNKEDILVASIKTIGAETLTELRQRWHSATTPEQVLRIYCEEIILKPYDMISSMPDSEELFSGITEGGQRALEQLHEQYTQDVIAKLRRIAPQQTEGQEALIGFFVAATKGLKTVTKDRATLESHLSVLSSLLIAQLHASQTTA